MISIQALLLDADERQTRNIKLITWLEQLKVILYEIEDVLDDIEVEILQKQVANRERTQQKVCHFYVLLPSKPIAFCVKTSCKVKKLRKRLDVIAAQMGAFDLVKELHDRPFVHKEREISDSLVQASGIIGRVNDREEIVLKHLTCLDDDQEHVAVLPIVGIGGLGKSTLAQIVFTDQRVVVHFERRMMVNVSDDFDLTTIIKYMIISMTGEYCDYLDIKQLQTRLKILLTGKRFLLILDDVRDHHPAKWNELKQLLMGGGRGSKIIITTRSREVASLMGTVSPFYLQGLSPDECLSLFKKCAFDKGQEESHPNLVEIGEEIVKKCRGVPLFVRSLGCSLYKTTNESDWLFVRESKIWNEERKENEIGAALKLSFSLLPSCLKPCLAFCSIIPKGDTFSSYFLIHSWMANDLILVPSNDDHKELEDMGMQYLKELVFRSFIYIGNFYLSSSLSLRMPDAIHDLVRQVAQSEHLRVSSMAEHVSGNVRHLSLHLTPNMISQQPPESLKKMRNVRSMHLFPSDAKARQNRVVLLATKSVLEMCISRFQHLRLLVLFGSSFEKLPNAIGTLKHMRYLNINGNRRLKGIPASICRLQSLQSLDLGMCLRLKTLPDNMGNLVSIRSLVITTQQMLLPAENGIECLSSLRSLQIFSCFNLKNLFKGVDRLENLRELVIDGCPSLTSLPCSMKYLRVLEVLVISNCAKLALDLTREEGKDGSTGNCGLLSLRTLAIQALPELKSFPPWLLQGSAKTLRELAIVSCPELMALPDELQNLSSLQKLQLSDCPKLKSLPAGMQNLSSLKEFIILLCPELSSRCRPPFGGQDWPKIAHVPDFYLDGFKVNPSSNN